jgi:hypothetical protein
VDLAGGRNSGSDYGSICHLQEEKEMRTMDKESKAAYDMQYAKENLQQIKFTLNKRTDADLLEWLNKQENKQKYLKELIRKDMTGV